MSHINVRIIEHNGAIINLTVDDAGNVWVNDRMASRPITADGLTFMWASAIDGLPSGAKIALTE